MDLFTRDPIGSLLTLNWSILLGPDKNRIYLDAFPNDHLSDLVGGDPRGLARDAVVVVDSQGLVVPTSTPLVIQALDL